MIYECLGGVSAEMSSWNEVVNKMVHGLIEFHADWNEVRKMNPTLLATKVEFTMDQERDEKPVIFEELSPSTIAVQICIYFYIICMYHKTTQDNGQLPRDSNGRMAMGMGMGMGSSMDN